MPPNSDAGAAYGDIPARPPPPPLLVVRLATAMSGKGRRTSGAGHNAAAGTSDCALSSADEWGSDTTARVATPAPVDADAAAVGGPASNARRSCCLRCHT